MKYFKLSSLPAIGLLLSSCGGSSDDQPLDTTYPVISVESQLNVVERETISLEATATDESGILSYQWRQKDGITVNINATNQAKISFSAPSLLLSQGTQQLTFEVSVTDNNNLTSMTDVIVNVSPISRVPVVTVASNELSNESGAFTTLSWEITENEPIASVALSSDNNSIRAIEIIDNAQATFNAPLAFEQETSTTLTLTITDEDNNVVYKNINLTSSPVHSMFKAPRLVFEHDVDIGTLSNELERIAIKDDNDITGAYLLSYVDGELALSQDLDLSALPESIDSSGQFVIDFDHDGKKDIVSMRHPEENTCDQIGTAEFILQVNYQNEANFDEQESLMSFGCLEVIGDDSPSLNIRHVKDFNDDGHLDIATQKDWYIFNPSSQDYEVDDRFKSEHYFDGIDRYVNKYPLDINKDSHTDILNTPKQSFEECGHMKFLQICANLEWAESLGESSYLNYVVIDEDLGTYFDFQMLDVNLDGTEELVVTFEPWEDPKYMWRDDEDTRWYTFSQGTVTKNAVEFISHFEDMTCSGTPYFVDINIYKNTLALFDYNNQFNKPVVVEVQQIPTGDETLSRQLLVDIEQDGDIDILSWVENKIYLIENISK